MKYKLINQPNENYSAKKQILINRGFAPTEIEHYFNLTDADINEPECFGEELLYSSAKVLIDTLDQDNDICVVVDCDCDGYTSAALMINYINDLKSDNYIENHVHWFMHEGKQHGLSDAIDWIRDIDPSLVIVPDAGSNDIQYLQELENDEIYVIILDHHEIEEKDFWNTEYHPYLFLINSQSSKYPNHDLSGVGVVYQFCRYVSKYKKLEDKHIEDWYLDLVALGLVGDMMSLKSCETRRFITKGLMSTNIRNPFIDGMWQKNMFKLGSEPTAWGVTFYIVPFVNAITRSGTLEEKELIFNSMLRCRAFNEILSNKRGHKLGEKERLVDQAVRTCTNVKNRQTREEEKGLELVTDLIEKNHMMDHKVLLFLLEPGQIKPEIRGLVANKLMAKYQRPCCMLTKTVEEEYVLAEMFVNEENQTVSKILQYDQPKKIKKIIYQGSARGCDKVGVNNFKDICAATRSCEYTIGHQGAFGLALRQENIPTFVKNTDFRLANMPNEPVYYVDYIWNYKNIDPQDIIDIAELDKYIGKDVDEPLVAIQGIQITKDMLMMMASNTMKITLPNNISLIKFRTPDEEYNKLYSENGYIEIDAVCRCNINEWNGNRYAQLFLDDYEIIGGCAYVF